MMPNLRGPQGDRSRINASSQARLVVLFLTAITAGTHAQAVDRELVVRRSRYTGLATFVTAPDKGSISVATRARSRVLRPADFLHAHGRLFGVLNPAEELYVARTDTDELGHQHTTYQQIHRGIEVFSGVLKIHQDVDTQVYAANGDFYPINGKLNTIATLGADEAADIAVEATGRGAPKVEQTRLTIVDPGWYGDPPIGEHLAYYVVVADWSVPLQEAFFVDAHTGAILDRWELLHSAKYRQVFDGLGGTSLPGSLVRWEGRPATANLEVDLAYDYMGDTYDFLYRAYGRDSLDGNGLSLIATVNSNVLECPNAIWSSTSRRCVFCAGLTVDDVVAHELTHGLTQFTSELIYQNQPGQLNESYSDVFGEAVDLFNGNAAVPGTPGGTPWPKDGDYAWSGTDTPNTRRTDCRGWDSSVRWLIAEDWTPIRDMWDPTCFNDPDRANSPLQTCDPRDYGGVHSGSGIPNHAFAIATDGKNFNGYDVNGIGLIKSTAVWYRAMTTYLTPSSDFKDAYDALNRAAADLIGTFPYDPRTGLPSGNMFTVEDAAEVDKALLAVEMNTDGTCGATVAVLDPTPPDLCPSRVTIYSHDLEGDVSDWISYVTGGNPPTVYPWLQVGNLPLQREGKAFYCEDPDIGDCSGQDESAVHSLFSPMISLPSGVTNLKLMFTHYVATEAGWDGGNLRVNTDAGGWQLVPASAFEHNTYNSTLNLAGEGNTNPLAGEPGFTGAGGGWGTSLVDLSALTAGARVVQLRFDFGKDGCTGLDGWYVDDVELFQCANCPEGVVTWHDPPDGVIDARQPRDISDGTPQGIDTIVAFGPAGADSACWSMCETDVEGPANCIQAVNEIGPGAYTIELQRRITPGATTTITYTGGASQTTGTFTSLPADSNADLVSNTVDVLSLIDCCLNGVCVPPFFQYSCDIDHSDAVNSADILRLIDLLNGAGEFFRVWNLESPADNGEC